MSGLIWINGSIVPFSQATINVEDRGFQFADGVYEVIRIYNGRPFALSEHMKRLENSAAGIQLPPPMNSSALAGEIEKFIVASGVREGMIYLQLTRGVAERAHAFPRTQPTLLFYARELPPVPEPGTGDGAKLISVSDDRWKRCWIKSIALLPNILAKNAALACGADEAVFIDNGIVTECSASNFFAVFGNKLATHPVGPKVLPGVTRAVLFECAALEGNVVEERPLREEEVRHADEMFIASTTREISWVGRWSDREIGSGRCGPITRKLHVALRERISRECHIRESSAGSESESPFKSLSRST